MGEIGAVDDDDDIGPGRNQSVGGLADATQQLRQAGDHLGEPHDRQFAVIEQRRQPLPGKAVAADANQLHRPAVQRPQRRDQISAEQVARNLAGDNPDFQWLVHIPLLL